MLIQPGPPEPLAGSFIEPMGWRIPVAYYAGLGLEAALSAWAADTGAKAPQNIERGAGFAGAMLHYSDGGARAYLALPVAARYVAEDKASAAEHKIEVTGC